MKKLIILVLLSLLIVPFVLACSCIAPGTPLEELDRSDAVFSGKVLSIEDTGGYNEVKSRDVVFELYTSWKSSFKLYDTVKVRTARDSAACGYGFQKGEEYLVYAYKYSDSGNMLSANICSRTKLLSQADEDIKELNGEENEQLIKIPSEFSLSKGETAKITNYQDMKIELINTDVCPPNALCLVADSVNVKVTTPMVCGPTSTSVCSPDFEKEYTLYEGKKVDILGIILGLNNVEKKIKLSLKSLLVAIIVIINRQLLLLLVVLRI
ncbi:hypothetical protein HYV88_02590 [Candidatus Woesearchaeota archaeon]|nr:hypothetical protein [Candidatus Woesearchaeota archaeon]